MSVGVEFKEMGERRRMREGKRRRKDMTVLTARDDPRGLVLAEAFGVPLTGVTGSGGIPILAKTNPLKENPFRKRTIKGTQIVVIAGGARGLTVGPRGGDRGVIS